MHILDSRYFIFVTSFPSQPSHLSDSTLFIDANAPRLVKKVGKPTIKKNTPTPVSATAIALIALEPTTTLAWKISHKPKPEDRGARRRRTAAISNLFGIILSLDYECRVKIRA